MNFAAAARKRCATESRDGVPVRQSAESPRCQLLVPVCTPSVATIAASSTWPYLDEGLLSTRLDGTHPKGFTRDCKATPDGDQFRVRRTLADPNLRPARQLARVPAPSAARMSGDGTPDEGRLSQRAPQRAGTATAAMLTPLQLFLSQSHRRLRRARQRQQGQVDGAFRFPGQRLRMRCNSLRSSPKAL
jgi:hypothetical protein